MDTVVIRDGKQINTYRVGEGCVTCILLSGSSILFPKWEYMPLVDEMAQYCEMVVIEKLGYGQSDLTESPREIDTIIEEYRHAIKVLKVQTPVILMAHSMGFLEALRWTQKFPNEVAGIVGLDPATPNAYKDFNVEKQMKMLLAISKNKVLKKAMVHMILRKLFKQRKCTLNDRKQLKGLACTKIMNSAWISEAKFLRKNIELISKKKDVQVPLLFFISNGKGTSQSKKVWRTHALHYLSNHTLAQYELMDYPHNLYEYNPKEIARRSNEFILEIQERDY